MLYHSLALSKLTILANKIYIGNEAEETLKTLEFLIGPRFMRDKEII